MEISELAAKQKRVLDWRAMLPLVQDLEVRRETETKLAQFSELLYRTWRSGTVDQASQAAIVGLERQLEQLNDEGRIRIVGRSEGPERLH